MFFKSAEKARELNIELNDQFSLHVRETRVMKNSLFVYTDVAIIMHFESVCSTWLHKKILWILRDTHSIIMFMSSYIKPSGNNIY